ncbi:MAG: serine hydrolase [Bacteroidia bacterium]|nr:serine hydrolase [Bacteroidia bacterium]
MKKSILLVTAIIFLTVRCSNSKSEGSDSNSVVAINDTCKAIDKYLSQLSSDKNFSGGLLIIRSGKKIFCKGYGWANHEQKIPFNANTLASMGSITKAFTAAAIMKLYEQKKLTLDDPLKKFFPNVPLDKAAITIHQLLIHSSGFHEFLENDGGDYEKVDTEEFLRRAFSEPLSFPPGEKAIYTNVGMSILAIIIERVSGKEYEEFLSENLFAPAGIKNIGYRYPESATDTIAVGYRNGKSWGTHQQHFKEAGGGPYWNLKGNGGLEASLNDMFLWANAFTNHTFLTEATIQKMFMPHIEEEGTNGRYHFGYGCNISQSRRNTKVIDNGGSNGIYFARMLRLPQEGLVFYMVTNESSVNANMVLPNVTQLYFQGSISQDAMTVKPKFETQLSEEIYKILEDKKPADLEQELRKANIKVNDDMILLDVGQRLIEEKKADEALALYKYYTKQFPGIIVAWNDMGDVYLRKGNKEEAIKCYRQALSLRPGNPRAKENLDRLTK